MKRGVKRAYLGPRKPEKWCFFACGRGDWRAQSGFRAGTLTDIMSAFGLKTPLCQPITPPARKKAPFFRLSRPQIRPFHPPFPAQNPPKSPLLRTFPRPSCRTLCPCLSPRSGGFTPPFTVVSRARQWSVVSIQHSELVIHNSPSLLFRRESCLLLSGDGVVNAPPSSRVTRFRSALNATQTLTKVG